MPVAPEALQSALADRYAIEREIGHGGMAIVYSAYDRRHDRKVALKVLRPELAAVVGPERFIQEIRTTASLQHPHILPLYDSGRVSDSPSQVSAGSRDAMADRQRSGSTGEFIYYVMPFVDGETLRDRLNRERQLAVEEAVRIATDVADALDYAHRHGVIHRDIKPENILLHDGRPLVADFGIALAVSAAGGGRLTETGLSIGTPEYMSPEQASAEKHITAHADLYSLGAVLYEMLAGHPPHMGSSIQQVILKILTEDTPTVTAERRAVPPNVAAAVTKALEKLPADRFASGAAFAAALNDRSFRSATSAAMAGRGRQAGDRRPSLTRAIPWLVAGVALVVAAIAMLGRTDRRRPVRAHIILPDIGEQPDFDLSADGRTIAYRSADGQLRLRALDALEALPVSGAEHVTAPRFSPDGRSIAFYDDGLWRIALDGGPPVYLTDSVAPYLDWGDDGFIYFTHAAGYLARIPEGGGTVEALTEVDTLVEGEHRAPSVLPRGRGVLFRIQRWPAIRDDIAVLDLRTGERRILTTGQHARYAASGYLVIGRVGGDVAGVPFDLSRLEMQGVPIPLVAETTERFALSDHGAFLYQSASGRRGLVAVARDGGERWLPEELADGSSPRVDPAGHRIALEMAVPAGIDIWVYDLRDSTMLRLTFEGDNIYPSWSGDGAYVLYASAKVGAPGGGWTFYRRKADGSGERERVLAGFDSQVEIAERPDDGYVVRVGDVARGQSTDIFAVERDGSNPRPIAARPFSERALAVSPDGRLVAYVSNESGRDEVYVRALGGNGARHLVSSGGGTEPAWSSDGSELFYRSTTHLMAAGIRVTPSFAVDARRQLFPIDAYTPNQSHTAYDVMPPDDTFLFVARRTPGDLVLVLDWFEELRAQVAR